MNLIRELCRLATDDARQFGNANLWELSGHAIRAGRLALHPVLRKPKSRPKGDGLVVTLTTLPSRIKALRPTIASLLDQTVAPAEIVLAVPRWSEREQRPYELPHWLTQIDSALLTVLRTEKDEGPATKLLPVLRRAPSYSGWVVAVDDDVIYPQDFLATLTEACLERPHAALGFRGFVLPPHLDIRETRALHGSALKNAEQVDILSGTWGLAVKPIFFDARVRQSPGLHEDAFFVDDVWFSGHLAQQNVPRYVVPCRFPPITRLVAQRSALSVEENSDWQRDLQVIRRFSESFGRRHRQIPKTTKASASSA